MCYRSSLRVLINIYKNKKSETGNIYFQYLEFQENTARDIWGSMLKVTVLAS